MSHPIDVHLVLSNLLSCHILPLTIAGDVRRFSLSPSSCNSWSAELNQTTFPSAYPYISLLASGIALSMESSDAVLAMPSQVRLSIAFVLLS